MSRREKISTGIGGLDRAVDMLRMGDNVVWQIDGIGEYKYIAEPFARQALADGRKLIYVRFGRQPEAVPRLDGMRVYYEDASAGFEKFAMEIHRLIGQEGREAFYIFDCLTELLDSWYSDLMIGNFFRVTCPYLYQMDTVSYFAVRRGYHTYDTIARIRQTTQCLLDIYDIKGNFYVHPLKATGRYSPSMFFPHRMVEGDAVSITASAETAELFSGVRIQEDVVDCWERMIHRAKKLLREPEAEQEQEEMKRLMIRIFLDKNPRMQELSARYFTLADLVRIISREIGTGYIGGKSAGMLLARKIIECAGGREAYVKQYMAAEDSFFIGTDTFYTYIVQNGWWELRARQRTEEGYFSLAGEMRERLLSGSFPEKIEYEFIHMLEYFGQAPIIVRSSSLLEDHFGNAFAGKYDSIFCVNQGTPEERLEALEDAVRRVYASTMNRDALEYRRQRGMDAEDEQMAILVQRVSGDYYGKYFFPHAAGVGNSSNLYVWSDDMDAEAGMLRLVVGLGTRAVDRVTGDYVRLVPLDDPTRKPLMTLEDERKYSQHQADVLNLEANEIQSISVDQLMQQDIRAPKSLFASPDYEEARRLAELGYRNRPVPYTVHFGKMLSGTAFPQVMKDMLRILEQAYDYPVDTEFTANYTSDTDFRVNLVQCRPLQTKGVGSDVELPDETVGRLFASSGNFMGGNVCLPVTHTIFVDARAYLALPEREKYEAARCIGALNEKLKDERPLLIGPGRWGTTTPSLGVPVHFTEISHMTAICEAAYPEEGIMPELSYGSHFFQDLVETGIFYVALFCGREGVSFREEELKRENFLEEYLPDQGKFDGVIFVEKQEHMTIYSSVSKQKVVCCFC